MSDAEREGAQGQTMLKNIESLDTKIKELDASMGVHTRNVGNYASGFNMLGFQIQRVAVAGIWPANILFRHIQQPADAGR